MEQTKPSALFSEWAADKNYNYRCTTDSLSSSQYKAPRTQTILISIYKVESIKKNGFKRTGCKER